MTLLGQNGHGQWKHDPQLARRRTIIGITVGGTIVLAALMFVLVYFVIISPPNASQGDFTEEKEAFVCSSV